MLQHGLVMAGLIVNTPARIELASPALKADILAGYQESSTFSLFKIVFILYKIH